MQHLIGEEKERTVVGAVLSLFLLVTKRLYGKDREWSIGQIKTCCKKQHVKIDDMKEMSDLFCSKAAVGGNYNLTRDTEIITFIKDYTKEKGFKRIELNMWEFNQGALEFYEAVGFNTYRRYMELFV